MMLKVLLLATLVAGFLDISTARVVRSKVRPANDKDVVPVLAVNYTIIVDKDNGVRLHVHQQNGTLTGTKLLIITQDWKSIVKDDQAVSTALFTAPELNFVLNASLFLNSRLLSNHESAIVILKKIKIVAVVTAKNKDSGCELDVSVVVTIRNPSYNGEKNNIVLTKSANLIPSVAKGFTAKFNEILGPILRPLVEQNIEALINRYQDWKNIICPFDKKSSLNRT